MKLFYSTASPYARKVVVAAREAGVIDQLEIISTGASPIDPNQDIVAVNPIGKLPALVLDDGRAIFDSRVICEYIGMIGDKNVLYPTNREDLIAAQTLQALGDGILDASLLVRYETFMRPPERRWDEWTQGQRQKVTSSIDYLEKRCMALLDAPMNIGQIAIACALAYVDFREVLGEQVKWPADHDKLAKWYGQFSAHESMKATEPN